MSVIIDVKMELDGYILDFVDSTLDAHYDLFRTNVVKPSILCRHSVENGGVDIRVEDMIMILDKLCKKHDWLYRYDVVDNEPIYEIV